MPADRPRTAEEAAFWTAPAGRGHQDQDQDPGAELAARWQREAPWPGSIGRVPGRAGDECPECGGPLSWEPRRTLVYCPQCKRGSLPRAVLDHYERQRAEAVIRQRTDPMAEKAARAKLRAHITRATEWVNRWARTVGNPRAYSQSEWQQAAREFAATLRGWIPEIQGSASEKELIEIGRLIFDEVIDSDLGRELRAEYEVERSRARQAEPETEDEDEDDYEAEDGNDADVIDIHTGGHPVRSADPAVAYWSGYDRATKVAARQAAISAANSQRQAGTARGIPR